MGAITRSSSTSLSISLNRRTSHLSHSPTNKKAHQEEISIKCLQSHTTYQMPFFLGHGLLLGRAPRTTQGCSSSVCRAAHGDARPFFLTLVLVLVRLPTPSKFFVSLWVLRASEGAPSFARDQNVFLAFHIRVHVMIPRPHTTSSFIFYLLFREVHPHR